MAKTVTQQRATRPVGLRRARRAAGLTQAQLAERVGTSQVTISRLETGARGASVALLSRIATDLRRNVDTLLRA